MVDVELDDNGMVITGLQRDLIELERAGYSGPDQLAVALKDPRAEVRAAAEGALQFLQRLYACGE